jgi:hypothetical protein
VSAGRRRKHRDHRERDRDPRAQASAHRRAPFSAVKRFGSPPCVSVRAGCHLHLTHASSARQPDPLRLAAAPE